MASDVQTAILEAAPVFWLSVATSGLCFLGLWSARLIQPYPRCAAVLLLLSAAGAGRALLDVPPPTLAAVRWLPFVAAPLLLFVAVFTLLGQESSQPPSPHR
ncbi:MAG TPA: hypothetical protein VII06_29775 [Chloroflexota bacterium]|jgi:hypothetical protein